MKPFAYFFLMAFVVYGTRVCGQFALIHDAEGFVNVRSEPEFKNNVIDTLHTGRVVWCFEKVEKKDWYNVDYCKKGNFLNGYIHKSRLKLITDFERIPVKNETKDQVIFQKDSIKVTILRRNFIAAEHKLLNKTNSGLKYLAEIDNEQIWGTDGGIPKIQYKSITVDFGRRKTELPDSALKNLFEPNFNFTEVHCDRKGDKLFINAMNSDGAGGYVVLLIIEKGQYKSRMVTLGF
ncbi:MAG: hypothetical protein SFV55_12820 [Haliscomenobacter sp.]|uniref:hypothetical protein n=1 Tax=Haliscomenobacter sp. TaxID=2717303 RepID=UPI0029ACE45E|nr:hypothetical protein [Haliscomenobacter sp.]MDX2069300.1 hypothetical protein [Haliscomenobacter sp.]